MSFDIRSSLRRLKPHKKTGHLYRRDRADLPFVKPGDAGGELLLDTTVYVDTLQKRIPQDVLELQRLRQTNHSAIAIGELAHALGRSNPDDSIQRKAAKAIETFIDGLPAHRTYAPSVEVIAEAGILAGTVCRLVGMAREDYPAMLNDAILFLQAQELGVTLLTRNIKDLDYMLQLIPAGQVLFYDQLP